MGIYPTRTELNSRMNHLHVEEQLRAFFGTPEESTVFTYTEQHDGFYRVRIFGAELAKGPISHELTELVAYILNWPLDEAFQLLLPVGRYEESGSAGEVLAAFLAGALHDGDQYTLTHVSLAFAPNVIWEGVELDY